jgi:hypothetical protein
MLIFNCSANNIFLKTPVGTLMRENNTNIIINLKNNKDNRLYIIVENLGRLNFGDRHSMLDTKVTDMDRLLKMFAFILLNVL